MEEVGTSYLEKTVEEEEEEEGEATCCDDGRPEIFLFMAVITTSV